MITALELRQILDACSRRIHFVGIAGIGMSGLAKLLAQSGHQVSGSDVEGHGDIKGLRSLNIQVHTGHHPEHLGDADLVVYSSAVQRNNAELEAARDRGIPLIRRATLLVALMRKRVNVAVAGMHGKSTTSAMVAYILKHSGFDPSFSVGAQVSDLGGNSCQGGGDFFVAEADESDGTLVEYIPEVSMLLNIEEEHLDFYHDLQAILDIFGRFASNTKEKVFFCLDDRQATRICADNPKCISYGLGEGAEYRSVVTQRDGFTSRFSFYHHEQNLGEVTLNIPGLQNVTNATGAIATCLHLGVRFELIVEALREFRGVDRRFEKKLDRDGMVVIDDYGHHPTEIRATLEAAKNLGRGRLFVIFQPHRFSRTKLLCNQFATAFIHADVLFLTDIYSASETPIEGITGSTIFEAVRATGQAPVIYEPDFHQIIEQLLVQIRPGDTVLTLGAGNIHKLASQLIARLRPQQGTTGTFADEDQQIILELKQQLSSEAVIKHREPMAKYTTMRIGGVAQFWIEPACERDLARTLEVIQKHQLPFFILGRGSNLLVLDGGLKGVVLRLAHPSFCSVTVEGERVIAGAGAKLRDVTVAAKRAELAQLEFLEGIPGTLGGALRMNAGAMGQWAFEVVESVRFMDFSGKIYERKASEIHFEYRGCPLFKDHIALSATLKGVKSSKAAILSRHKAFEEKRWGSQPAAPSAGCIFKNPKEIPAGKLIDELGLKGTTIGGAKISEVHGNFIVNQNKATAGDVLKLIELIQEKAWRERGIRLETEVIILGEKG